MAFNSASLIFDRTRADVDYALALERAGVHSDDDLRGAYNAGDRNRVAAAINFLVGTLSNYGRLESVRSGWREGEIVRPPDNAATLSVLEALRRVLPDISLEIPASLDELDWRLANAVERILFDMYANYYRLTDMWLWAGEGYAGHELEEHKLDDWWA